jgi:hypothetical protein
VLVLAASEVALLARVTRSGGAARAREGPRAHRESQGTRTNGASGPSLVLALVLLVSASVVIGHLAEWPAYARVESRQATNVATPVAQVGPERDCGEIRFR